MLQLHEDHVGLGDSDVLARMFLRRKPCHHPRGHVDFPMLLARFEASAERTQRVHHTVGVVMGIGSVTGPVPILENPHLLVLEDDPIQMGGES
ncbi:MAG: hypothetical protein ACRDVK_00970 [Acidimicrobiia bacterium]